MAYNDSRNPLRVLQERIGDQIVVRLKDGTEYTGDLQKYDNFMNLIISNANIVMKDENMKTSPREPEFENATDIFIRGNNVLFILPKK